MVSICLRAPSGEFVLPGGPLVLEENERALKIRQGAIEALNPRPGFRCRLLLGARILEDSDVLNDDLCLFAGDTCEVLAVLEMEPVVVHMIDLFRETMRILVDEERSALQRRLSYHEASTRSTRAWRSAAAGSESDEGEAPWKQACDELERLGKAACPAAPAFLEWMADSCPEVRQVATWAIGGLASEALPFLPQIIETLREDKSSSVRDEAAQAMLSLASAVPAEMMLELSPGGRLESDYYWWLTARALRCLRPGPASEALVPQLVHAVKEGHANIRAEAVRALGRVNRKALREAVQADLVDSGVWQHAQDNLDERLRASLAARGPEAQVSASNASPFPLPEKFEPLSLRAWLYEGEGARLIYESSVPGEAAWQCVEQQCIAEDRFVSRSQERLAALRATHGPLPRVVVSAKLAVLKQHFLLRGGRPAKHFFERLELLEGNDPLHGWLFPSSKGPPEDEDYELPSRPRALPVRWVRRAGPSCLRLLRPRSTGRPLSSFGADLRLFAHLYED